MNEFLEEAKRIGDQLLEEAQEDAHGLFWRTADARRDGIVTWQVNEILYTGASGIALFLIKLYQQTNHTPYLEAAEKAMQWSVWHCKTNEAQSYALYTGRMGVSFTLIQLYNATKKKIYMRQALTLAKPSLLFLDSEYPVYDLLNGFAGTLLGLLHLHEATNEPWVLNHIAEYTKKLLNEAKLSDEGLYWDRTISTVVPLSGMSHGSGGIGFVFLELAHYFNNPAFRHVAEQAFAYENHHFDKAKNNWKDLRLNIYSDASIKQYKESYLKNDLKVFTEYLDTNQWCHGAPGIGLTRLRWYELSKSKQAKTDLDHALDKTAHDHSTTLTLCHGSGGKADLFLETYALTQNKKYLQFAQNVSRNALAQKQNLKKYEPGMNYDFMHEKEDASLFNGIAGIGYFYLRLLDPKAIPSILAPKVSSTAKTANVPPILRSTVQQVNDILTSNLFPRTNALLNQSSSHDAKIYDKATIITSLKKRIASLPHEQKEAIQEVFDFEMKKLSMLDDHQSNGYVYIKDLVDKEHAQKINELSDAQLVTTKLLLSSLHVLQTSNTLGKSFLLKRTAEGIEELEVSEFCVRVLTSFEKKTSVGDVIESLQKVYHVQTKQDKTTVKKQTNAQIREALHYGILS